MSLFLRLITLAGVAALLGIGSAQAQDSAPDPATVERARTHFDAGTQYYAASRYDDAAREFEEAYRLTGHPDVLYNLAQSYDRLERYDEAIESYRSYLETAGEDAPERDRVERRTRELETLRDAAARDTEDQDEAGEAAARMAPDVPPPEDGGGVGALTWVTLGVGAASAITAIAFGVTASGIHSDLSDQCASACPPDLEDQRSKGQTFATMADVFGIAGAVLLAGGIVLLALDLGGGGSESDSSAASLEITTGPTPLGAGARWSF